MTQKNKITATYFGAFIVLGLVMSALGPTLPGLAAQTRSHLSEISILFTARSLGFMVGAWLAGRLFDRFSGHRLIALAITMMAILMAFIPFLSVLWLVTAVMFLIGIFEPGIDVGTNTLIVWLHRDKVSPFMNGLHFFFGVGAFFSPIIIAWVISQTDGIQWAFWIIAVLIFLPALPILRQPSPTPPAHTEEDESRPNSWLTIFLIAAFFFLYGGAEISFGGWIFTYATEQGISSSEAAALLTSVFWGALTAGRLVSIPLAARFRNRTLIFADLVGCLFSVGLILMWPYSLTAVWLGTIFLGFSMASVFPTTLSLAERHLQVSGKTTSYFFIGASIGAMTVPWLIGQWFEVTGPIVTMMIIFVCLVAALTMFGILMVQINKNTNLVLEAPHD